jgi:hypothetical protein
MAKGLPVRLKQERQICNAGPLSLTPHTEQSSASPVHFAVITVQQKELVNAVRSWNVSAASLSFCMLWRYGLDELSNTKSHFSPPPSSVWQMAVLEPMTSLLVTMSVTIHANGTKFLARLLQIVGELREEKNQGKAGGNGACKTAFGGPVRVQASFYTVISG